MNSTATLGRLAKTLAIGTIGGTLFAYFNLPLAWMLGAMVLTTAGSVAGQRLVVPSPVRSTMVTILGVLLGAAFTPDIVERAARWPLTLAGLLVYLVTVTGVLFVYFHRVLKFDPATAYFSAAPGGMSEMVITGAAMGGDDRRIALVQGCRVLLVVLVIPLSFRLATGAAPTAAAASPSLAAIAWTDLGQLGLCAVAGAALGRWVRLPAYRLLGPMLLSAALHVTGISATSPPYELVAAAQVVVGSAVGARFSGVPLRQILETLLSSLGSTGVMLLLTLAFALTLAPWSGHAWPPVVLAYSPGGLTEMSLIALSLNIEVAFVATHHVVRIALIVFGAPLAFRLLRRDRAPA